MPSVHGIEFAQFAQLAYLFFIFKQNIFSPTALSSKSVLGEMWEYVKSLCKIHKDLFVPKFL